MRVDRLCVAFQGWMVGDGNYPDLHVGEEVRFAVELHPHSLAPTPASSPSLTPIHHNRYRFHGPVVYRSKSVWIVDVGLLLYERTKPPAVAQVGAWLSGELELGVDPFFYFEVLYKLPGIPALIYPWRIERILLETTPWLSRVGDTGQTIQWREQSREAYTTVGETDYAKHDDGLSNYLLECIRIGEPSWSRT
jgi:hypothetical protein